MAQRVRGQPAGVGRARAHGRLKAGQKPAGAYKRGIDFAHDSKEHRTRNAIPQSPLDSLISVDATLVRSLRQSWQD